MMKMKFKEWDCLVSPAQYGNGRKAICLIEDGPLREPIAVATVNVMAEECPDDCAFIKEYSENEGMVSALHTAGLIEIKPIRMVESGHVVIPLHRLTEKALNLFK